LVSGAGQQEGFSVTDDTAKNAEQPRVIGRPFPSGNPGGPGRKEGSRNKATLILDALADGEAEEILRKALDAAKGGDLRAIDLVLARVWPPRKTRPVNFTLPPMVKAGDLVAGLQAVLDATANGDLTPDEAQVIGGLIEMKRKTIETAEIEERLSRLEAAQEAQNSKGSRA
jgi:hypothetical protein